MTVTDLWINGWEDNLESACFQLQSVLLFLLVCVIHIEMPGRLMREMHRSWALTLKAVDVVHFCPGQEYWFTWWRRRSKWGESGSSFGCWSWRGPSCYGGAEVRQAPPLNDFVRTFSKYGSWKNLWLCEWQPYQELCRKGDNCSCLQQRERLVSIKSSWTRAAKSFKWRMIFDQP